MKKFDIKKWSENNERLAKKCFEKFLRDHKGDFEEEKKYENIQPAKRP